MKLKDRFLTWLGLVKPEPQLTLHHNLSRRILRHEFTLLQVVEPGVFKALIGGRVQLLNMTDWKLFGRDLQAFCMHENIRWSALEQGTVRIRCTGLQENLPRGIKYTWQFSKL